MSDNFSFSPTVTSLFSGCGGLDHGFVKAGYKLIAAFDSDEHAIQAFNLNHEIKARQVEIGEGFNIPCSSDVVIAGPPCQGFSTGGGYKDADPRNALLLTTCRAIAKSNVKLAVIENVASLTNRKNKTYLDAALNILAEGGYYCDYAVLLASDFGVPQRRRRTVIIARSSARPFGGVNPIETPLVTVSDALAGLDETSPNHVPRFPAKGSKHDMIARKIGPNQKLCNVRGVTQASRLGAFLSVLAKRLRLRKKSLRQFGSCDARNARDVLEMLTLLMLSYFSPFAVKPDPQS